MRTAQEDSEDAEQTRNIVAAVLAESDRAQGDGSTEPEHELERALEEAMQGGEGVPLDDIERELMRDSDAEDAPEELEDGGAGGVAGGEADNGGGTGGGSELSEYEKERRENMKHNEQRLRELGLLDDPLVPPRPRPAPAQPRPPPRAPDGPRRESSRLQERPRKRYFEAEHSDDDDDLREQEAGENEPGQTLFEYAISRGNAKSLGCDGPENCERDGYLMAKQVLAERQQPTATNSVLGMRKTSFDVNGGDGGSYRLESLLANAPAAEDRFQLLNRLLLPDGRPAMESFVDTLCVIDPSVTPPRGVYFESFGRELAAWTDWFYAEEGKGTLFLRYVTAADARRKHLPSMAIEETSVDFLYVVLVCAGSGTGFGKTLVNIAERFAVQLGVSFVVLAALPHVVSYYFKLGFGLVDRSGNPIDAAPWLELDEAGRARLYPERKVRV